MPVAPKLRRNVKAAVAIVVMCAAALTVGGVHVSGLFRAMQEENEQLLLENISLHQQLAYARVALSDAQAALLAAQKPEDVPPEPPEPPEQTEPPEPPEPPDSSALTLDYQTMYPDLYAVETEKVSTGDEKILYLTFDDGPGAYTQTVLRILKEYDIKATFFVVTGGQQFSADALRAIAEAGHTLAIHSHTHRYGDIYASVEAFLSDFKTAYDVIYEATGVRCELFRFPGGSVSPYSAAQYKNIISEMLRRGFTYHDWNASAEDAYKKTSAAAILTSLKKATEKTRAVVLMHDAGPSAEKLVSVLPDFIKYALEKGYRFEPLDATVAPFTFAYKD